jgi:hypothetical protein
VAPGNPRELLADAVDQLAEISKTVVTMAVDSVVEPIADEGIKRLGEGIKLASEGVRIAGEGVKIAGEGVKMLRMVLRPKKDEPKKDEPKKG